MQPPAQPPPAPRLVLIREDLENLPHYPPPEGFRLRRFNPGDEVHWTRIHLAADDLTAITPDLFDRRFGRDPKPLMERQYYLEGPRDIVIGTATAWWDDHFEGGRWGRVHFVAVVPEYQGHGLGKVLMTAVCERLKELGHNRAYLATHPARTYALRLYEKFGFRVLAGPPV